MKVITAIAELRRELAQEKNFAFVPTMGALHAGHLSLIDLAKTRATRCLASIFLNPTQFSPNEDLAKYPRTLDTDLEKLKKKGTDWVFVPKVSEIYPAGFQTYIVNDTSAHKLCGKTRPQHFRGVLTVMLKLLLIVRPQVLVLGKKDYQQTFLITQMITDFCLPIDIELGETQRDEHGLALSSRNTYLNEKEREDACGIYRGLQAARRLYEAGERFSERLIEVCRAELGREGGVVIDYLVLCRQNDLTELNGDLKDTSCVLLIAAWVGRTRLIDNVEFACS